MPRVAVFADIHGNTPALAAVLADIARQAPDEVLVGGDLVGRGPDGRAVCHAVEAMGWRGVRGNHEDYLLNFRARRVPEAWWGLPLWSASRWMAAQLDARAASFIADLPLGITAHTLPSLHLFHGSPLSNDHGLGPWCTDAELDALLSPLPGDLLVCAHTHRSMDRPLASGRVVNVGSVGLPFNGDPRAQYAIFHRDSPDGPWGVELRAVPYDRAQTFDLYDRSGFLSEGGVTSRMLRVELELARPALVPFLKWAETLGIDPDTAPVADFFQLYDPDAPTADFYAVLDRLKPLT
jgi:predicted phosphodiesterase